MIVDLLKSMDASGKLFVKLSLDEDSAENKSLREKYASIVSAENQKSLLSPVSLFYLPHAQFERLTKEIIPLMEEYEREMEYLVVRSRPVP